MGLILDSSVLISAERKGERVGGPLKRVLEQMGNQEAELSTVALVELAHGIQCANTPEIRARRETFIAELLADVPVYPLTAEIAILAGKIDGDLQSRGVKIPLPDLLMGATASHLGYAVVTYDVRHFRMIPGLEVTQL